MRLRRETGFALLAATAAALFAPACSAHGHLDADPYLVGDRLNRKLAAMQKVTAGTSGSLWNESSPRGALAADNRSFKPGDIVRVLITEQTDAKQGASTDTAKKGSGAYAIPSLFGLETQMNGRVTPGFDMSNLLNYSRDKSFKGAGSTARSNDVTAVVSSRVFAVLPNGDLVIVGSKDVTVNRETQVLWLAGVARPIDLSSANSVASSNLSDLEFHLGGRGDIDASLRDGWLAKFFDRVWPF
ncbi:MAG TPA: flagellar basal body L-ring protein FlgH [Verrucomicrobiae bacterium]|nr:flagellar basal body L-ring protein FlgH [Verrucomicrobiae bacterium]